MTAARGMPKFEAGPQKSVQDSEISVHFETLNQSLKKVRVHTSRTEVAENWLRAYFRIDS